MVGIMEKSGEIVTIFSPGEADLYIARQLKNGSRSKENSWTASKK